MGSWSLYANHGGGYSYRLCPRSSNLTEECFQQHHLQFVGNKSWIQYAGKDESNRTAIDAIRVSEGTNPPGSQWTRNPIPACGGYVGGSSTPFDIPFLSNCHRPQFDPPLKDHIPAHRWLKPLPGLYGFGVGAVDQFRIQRSSNTGQMSSVLISSIASTFPQTWHQATMFFRSVGTASKHLRFGTTAQTSQSHLLLSFELWMHAEQG